MNRRLSFVRISLALLLATVPARAWAQTTTVGEIVFQLIGAAAGSGAKSEDLLALLAEILRGPPEPPALAAIGNRSVTLGDTLAIQLSASDRNDDILAFSAAPLPLPTGAALDGSSGLFTFAPVGSAQVGDHALTFIVSDGIFTDSETVTITVEDVAPGGQTGVRGYIHDANDAERGLTTPIVGATVRDMGTGAETTTDDDGLFLLSGLPAGTRLLAYDGSTATGLHRYGGYQGMVTLIEGATNTIPRPIYLMRIDTGGLAIVDADAETVVVNEALGITMAIPPQTVVVDGGGFYEGEISISQVPAAFTPSSLPPQLQFGFVVSVQPTGLTFAQPVPITFPNTDNLPNGTIVNLWSLNHDTGRFFISGRAMVQGDLIVTIEGGIREASWHAVAPNPPTVSVTDNSSNLVSSKRCCEEEVGSSAAVATGDLTIRHATPSYRSLETERSLGLVYHSTHADVRPIVKSDIELPLASAVPLRIISRATVGGVQQGEAVFTDATTLSAGDEIRQAIQFDANLLETGAYPYTLVQSNRYALSTISTFASASVIVRNERASPFGAGWSLEGLTRVDATDFGGRIVAEGDGSVVRFNPVGAATGAFGAAPDFATALNAYDVATGDFDEDGVVDLAVARFGGGVGSQTTVHIHLGDGAGGFGPETLQTVGTAPTEILVGRFDGDDHLDLVVTNFQSDFLSLLVGDGAGGFADQVQIPIGSTSVGGATGDFDEDGNLDLAIAIQTFSNSLKLLFGDGAGGFSEPVTMNPGVFARSVAVGDFNDDGHLDLATANNQSPGSVSVLLGDGSGEFLNVGRIPVRNEPYQVRTADLNGDGILDLAVPQYASSAVALLFGDGFGGFPTLGSLPTPARPHDVSVADVNLDGLADLVVANDTVGAGTVGVYLAEGNGCFSDADLLPAGDRTTASAVALLDADLIPDIVAIAYTTGRAFVYLGEPNDENATPGPEGDFTMLMDNGDGTVTRRFADGTEERFDAAGRQTAVVDRNGNATQYAYAGDLLTAITDPMGLTTTLAYQGGLLASVTDPAGRTTTFQHDGDGNLVRITEPDGTMREFAYDASHRMTSQVDARGMTTRYEFDFAGRISRVERPDGSERLVASGDLYGLANAAAGAGTESEPAPPFPLEDLFGSLTDGLGAVTTYRFDRFGGSLRTEDPLGRVTNFTRNMAGLPTVIDSLLFGTNRSETRTEYDGAGRVTRRSEGAAPFIAPLRETRFAYDGPFGQVSAITDPEGGVTTYEYDALGNVTRIENPLGHDRTMTYTARGRVATLTDEGGGVTAFTYDAMGNLATMTDAEGTVFRFERDGAGRIVEQTDGDGTPAERRVAYAYDDLNRTLTEIDDAGRTTQFRYDPAGNLLETERPTGEIEKRTYDSMGRLASIEDPLLGTKTFAYDANGRLTGAVDPLLGETSYAYDAAGQMIRVTRPDATEIAYTYYGSGSIRTMTQPLGDVTTFVRDRLDRITDVMRPNGAQTRYQYNRRSDLTRLIQPNGTSINYTYDAAGRLTRLSVPGDAVDFTHDARGNVLTIADGDSSLAFAYDGRSRVIQARTLDVGHQPATTIDYVLDEVGNRMEVIDSEGGTTQYVYDGDDRLTQVVAGGGGGAIDLFYDPSGRLADLVFPNGVASAYDYDARGRLLAITHTGPGPDVFRSFVYTRDERGSIVEVDEGAQIRVFDYDALGRLVAGGVGGAELYAYEANGNRESSHRSSAYTYDANDRIVEDDAFTYAHDANGRMTSKTAKAGGAETTYAYDALDRLVGIDHPDATTTVYRYDGLGRRIAKEVDGVATRYVYDGTDILLEYDGAGALAARYTHGDLDDQPLHMARGGQHFYFHADHRHSIRNLTDAAGDVVNTYDYDGFGDVEAAVAPVANPFGFAGRELDAASGLVYFRARYYDPTLGRFTQPDPTGFLPGEENLYAYASSNPVNLRDPSGLDATWEGERPSARDITDQAHRGAQEAGIRIAGKSKVEVKDSTYGPRVEITVRLDENGRPLVRLEDAKRLGGPPAHSLLRISVSLQHQGWGRFAWVAYAYTIDTESARIVAVGKCGPTNEDEARLRGDRPHWEASNDPEYEEGIMELTARTPQEAVEQALRRLGVSDGTVDYPTDESRRSGPEARPARGGN